MIKKHLIPAFLMTLVMCTVLGLLFPAFIWALSQMFFYEQANGSLLKIKETVVGSSLIGQKFTSGRYFHPRPSAAGAGYDPLASGGTNLGPTSNKLIAGILDDPETSDTDESYQGARDLAAAYRKINGLSSETLLPADAVTRSASGLDPHISPGNAKLQAKRVATQRNLPDIKVTELVSQNIEGRFLGVFGEPRVNVLKLNMALDNLKER